MCNERKRFEMVQCQYTESHKLIILRGDDVNMGKLDD